MAAPRGSAFVFAPPGAGGKTESPRTCHCDWKLSKSKYSPSSIPPDPNAPTPAAPPAAAAPAAPALPVENEKIAMPPTWGEDRRTVR